MNCEQIELLLVEWVLEPLRDSHVDWPGVGDHLRHCDACAAALRQVQHELSVISRAIAPGTSCSDNAFAPGSPRRTVPLRLHTLACDTEVNGCHRAIPYPRRRRSAALVAGAGALAACLLFAAWGYRAFHARVESVADRATSAQTIWGPDRIAVATQYDDHQQREFAVAPGDAVVAGPGQHVRLDVWGRHALCLEPDTQLVLSQSQDRGCVVALSRGQVSVSVNRVPAEGPCQVVTPHARLVVLGTVFNVVTTIDATRLSVSRGCVVMSTQAGASQAVSAGQACTTSGGAILHTAGDAAVAEIGAALLSDPLLALRQSDWYKHRFGCLLHLRDYLSEQKIAADETALLAISAEPWCLQRPHRVAAAAPDFRQRKIGLERAALWYGCHVDWPHPSTRQQAGAIAADALVRGSLVLAYGLDADAVRVRDPEVLDPSPNPDAWSYRFFGDTEATPFAMCVISRPGACVSRQQLAYQAIADIQALLAGPDDPDYDAGVQAVEPATATYDPSGPMSSAPVMKALIALSRLGPGCQDWLCTQAGRKMPDYPLYTLLDADIGSVFATGAFEATRCDQALLAQSADRCAARLQTLAKTLGGAAPPD